VRKRRIEARKTAKMQLQSKNSNLRVEQESTMLIFSLQKKNVEEMFKQELKTVHKIVPPVYIFRPKHLSSSAINFDWIESASR